MTVGVKAKKLLASAIIIMVLCGILAILLGVILAVMLSGEVENVYAFVFIIVFLLAFIAILLGFYIPILVRLCRSPEVVIAKKDFDFELWCGKDGSVLIPCDAVAEARPIRVFWTASLITLLSDNYDASVLITLTDGRVYKVPYVQKAKHVCAQIMNLAFEVRAQKEVLAFKAQKEREEAANAEIAPKAEDAPNENE